MFYVLLRFPGQQKVAGDSKIPSIVCYDEDGKVVAVGSETDPDTNPELFETPGIVRSEWYSKASFPDFRSTQQISKGLNCIFVPLAWLLSKDSTRRHFRGTKPPSISMLTFSAIYSTQRDGISKNAKGMICGIR